MTPSGARSIGHVVQAAPLAWLHEFFPGAAENDLKMAASCLRPQIPEGWKHVLRAENGMVRALGVGQDECPR